MSAVLDDPRALSRRIASNAQAMARATMLPWIVSVRTRRYDPAYASGAYRMFDHLSVVQQGMCNPPDPAAFVPLGSELMRADIFPATRFDELCGPAARRLYEPHYRAYLAWRSQHAGIVPDGESVAYRADQWCKDGRP